MESDELLDATSALLESCLAELDQLIVDPGSGQREEATKIKADTLRAMIRLDMRRRKGTALDETERHILEELLRNVPSMLPPSVVSRLQNATSGRPEPDRITQEREILERDLQLAEQRTAQAAAAQQASDDARRVAELQAREAEAVAERAAAAAAASAQQCADERSARELAESQAARAYEERNRALEAEKRVAEQLAAMERRLAEQHPAADTQPPQPVEDGGPSDSDAPTAGDAVPAGASSEPAARAEPARTRRTSPRRARTKPVEEGP